MKDISLRSAEQFQYRLFEKESRTKEGTVRFAGMASNVPMLKTVAFTLKVTLLLVACFGCKPGESSAADVPAPEVEVVEVVQEDVPIYSEWVGTTDGLVNATIQAQVTGYLMKRAFVEGALFKTGDLPFEIDPRPFRATPAETKGQLGQAQAQHVKAELDVKRDTPLAKAKAISQKELDDSTQALAGGKAAPAFAKAARERAELNSAIPRSKPPSMASSALRRPRSATSSDPAQASWLQFQRSTRFASISRSVNRST